MSIRNLHTAFLALASLTISVIGYRLGLSDQSTQLPLVLHQMQLEYLANDFFVQANDTFGPRFYYMRFMAWGSQMLGVSLWWWGLTWLTAYGASWVTYRMVVATSQDTNAALLAGVMVLAWPTPTLATSTFTTHEILLTPTALVFPLILGALYLMLAQRRIVWACALVGLASLFQVLYGLSTGLLLLAVYGWGWWRIQRTAFPLWRGLVGGLVLGGFAALNLVPYYTQTVSAQLDTATFVHTVAYFRNPHHYAPSQFPVQDWLLAATLIGTAIAVGLQRTRKGSLPAPIGQGMAVILVLIGVVMLGGWLFVEVWPSRLFTTAQTFRYIILLKWLTIVVLSPWLVRLPAGRALLAMHPFTLPLPLVARQAIVLLVLPLALWALPLEPQLTWLVGLLLLAATWLWLFPPKPWPVPLTRRTLIAFGLTANAALVLVGMRVPTFAERPPVQALPAPAVKLLDAIVPRFTVMHSVEPDLADVGAWIAAHTPDTAILITPPNLTPLRLAADRALVVDFKSFPYQDAAMLEWIDRMAFCYGTTEKLGFAASEALSDDFQAIGLAQLRHIRARYGADFAVLRVPIEGDKTEAVVYKNAGYAVIAIAD